MMKRVAFLDYQKAYRKSLPEPEAPIGFAFLSAVIKPAGYSCHLFPCYEGLHDVDAVIAELVQYEPTIVAANGTFGVFGPDLMIMLAEIRKRLPNAITIVGGIAVTSSPHVYLKQPEVDYIFLGEGEVGFLEFCEAVCGGGGS